MAGNTRKQQYTAPELREQGRIATDTLESNTSILFEQAHPLVKTDGMAI
jgi:hypothetical protein